MKKIFKEHVEMVKVIKATPLKELAKAFTFAAMLSALLYFSILIFG